MDLLDRLLGHDAWTTRQLLRHCRKLSDEQLDREFDIGHRSVRATLAHIICNVEIWSQLVAGRQPMECPGATIGELTTRFDRAAAELARVARLVAGRRAWDERFLDILDSPPVEKTLGGAIAHVVTHSMHHRAQLLFMLRRLGINDLPEGDVLTWEEQAARVHLRQVERSDLDDFFEHQRDPVAVEMAAFPPRERAAFMAHWHGILADPRVIARTILLETTVAGNVICWEQAGKWLIGYWLGRRYWGQGIASHAILAFVENVSARPLHAYVAKRNVASIRVLERAGFHLVGDGCAAAPTGVEPVDEFLYELTE